MSYLKRAVKIFTATIFLLFPFDRVVALNQASPFLSRFGIEDLTIGADYLWWNPIIDNLNFGYTAIGNTLILDEGNDLVVQYATIIPKWAPGVRLNLEIPSIFCNLDLTASGTWIKSQGQATLLAPPGEIPIKSNVVNTLIHPFIDFFLDQRDSWFHRKIAAQWNSTYLHADVLLSTKINLMPCFDFSPYFGIAGISFKQTQEAQSYSINVPKEDFNIPTDFMNWQAKYWGVGLKAGASFEQRINSCFAFFGNANASLLAGKVINESNVQTIRLDEELFSIVFDSEEKTLEKSARKPFSDNDASFAHLIFKDNDRKLIVSGCHLQGGLKYKATLFCCDLTLRLGYEFIYWLSLPSPRVFDMSFQDNQFSGGSYIGRYSLSDNRSVGFNGLFAGLQVLF